MFAKYAALGTFILQNAGVILLMRYSKVMPGPGYDSSVAVLCHCLLYTSPSPRD